MHTMLNTYLVLERSDLTSRELSYEHSSCLRSPQVASAIYKEFHPAPNDHTGKRHWRPHRRKTPVDQLEMSCHRYTHRRRRMTFMRCSSTPKAQLWLRDFGKDQTPDTVHLKISKCLIAVSRLTPVGLEVRMCFKLRFQRLRDDAGRVAGWPPAGHSNTPCQGRLRKHMRGC